MEGLLRRNIGIEKYFSYIVIKSPIVKTIVPLKTLLSIPRSAATADFDGSCTGPQSDVVRFLAPLVLSEQDLGQALAILDNALASELVSITA
jgi:hypothetical protein